MNSKIKLSRKERKNDNQILLYYIHLQVRLVVSSTLLGSTRLVRRQSFSYVPH